MRSREKFLLKDFRQITKASSKEVNVALYEEVWHIVQVLKKREHPDLEYALTNYAIIRLVSILENYFVNRVKKMIDEEGFEPKGVFQDDEITISLLELKEIKNDKEVTTGKIVSNKLSFQRPDDINFILSKLLGYSFFEKMNKERYSYTFAGEVNTVDFSLKEFYQLFSFRHQIVHELNSRIKIDVDKLSRLFAQTLLFISISHDLIETEVLHSKSKKKI